MIIEKLLKYLLFSLSVVAPNWVLAQCEDVFEATREINLMIKRQSFLPSDTIGGYFVKEINELVADTGQYIVNTDSVIVGLLVLNVSPDNKNIHDYSAYWKGKTQTANRYTWVFILDDFHQKCVKKGINCEHFDNATGDLSKRLCRLLGLSDVAERDTIVYMQVPANQLFRPAYNPDIHRLTSSNFRGENDNINSMDIIDRRWMLYLQFSNTYPWTRMGYTYDWGDINSNYVGVTEFVLKPYTKFKNLGFYLIGDYLKY